MKNDSTWFCGVMYGIIRVVLALNVQEVWSWFRLSPDRLEELGIDIHISQYLLFQIDKCWIRLRCILFEIHFICKRFDICLIYSFRTTNMINCADFDL